MVFDSGIGGTTVLEQIQALIPDADYSYFMDNALLPYGAQSQQTIIVRLFALLQFIETANLHVDILVIACNTASTSALETIRQHTNIEVVGVVPAIKPACAISTHFPLLASAISDYYKQQIFLIDSGKAIAKRVESLIALRGFTLTTDKKKPLHYYATAPIGHSQLSVELITLTDQIPHESC